MSSICIHW